MSSAETGRVLIIVGVGLAVLGLAMLRPSTVRASRARTARVDRRRTRRGGRVPGLAGWSGALACTALTGGVIVGVEWAILGQTGSAAVWTVALGLPALLAGATVTRLLLLVVGLVSRRAYLLRRRGLR
jgi:hypothetical protein